MSGGPRVTVLLPTYDAVEHVEAAIESLLAQTYEDFEVLVVDDGSVDGTQETVRSFDDERVDLLVREGEPGLVAALNEGLDRARGEYVARQDADDRSALTRLACQVAYLDVHPSVAMVGTGAYLVSHEGSLRARRRVLERPSLADLQAKNHFVHGSVMFRRAAVERAGGYDPTMAVSEDYDLWLRLARSAPVRNLDEPLYVLRLGDESVYSSRLRESKLYGRFARDCLAGRVDPELAERVAEVGIEPYYEWLSPTERATVHRSVGQELLRYGRRREARQHLWRALWLARLGPSTIGLYALSFCPAVVVGLAVGTVRASLNAAIRWRNWSDADP